MMTDVSELRTSQQVADVTGRKRVTILALRQRYDLGQRVGRDWLFTPEDVTFIASINPLGGRPAKAGKNAYTKDPAQVKKGRPPAASKSPA